MLGRLSYLGRTEKDEIARFSGKNKIRHTLSFFYFLFFLFNFSFKYINYSSGTLYTTADNIILKVTKSQIAN